jgi:uncharacterized iron-regulated membrane protein
MSFKKVIGKVHLWLGLASGLVVVIVAITGCLYAFQAEIQHMTQPYRFTEAQEKPYLPPSQLKAIAEKALPGKHIHSMLYGSKTSAAEATFYNADPEYYYAVYLNPYTGEVLKVKDMNAGFFRIVLDGHYYLWLPPAVGQPIVAVSTLVFVVMMITGLILWWPKNKGARKQRFSVKWNARWRRVNYDLHNVFGFYMTWVVIFIALTGLVWGFQWFAKAAYWSMGGEKSMLYEEPLSDTTHTTALYQQPVDIIWDKLNREAKNAETIEMHFPETPAAAISANTNPDADTYWQTDYRYFDQYTLKELSAAHVWGSYKDAKVADKVMRMNYDVHTGAVLGLPGKFLAFFASLIAASLPVTGFMIWLGRKRKKVAGRKLPVAGVVSATA